MPSLIEMFDELDRKGFKCYFSPKLRIKYLDGWKVVSHPEFCKQHYLRFCEGMKYISEREEDGWEIITHLGEPILAVQLNKSKTYLNFKIPADGKFLDVEEGTYVNMHGYEGFAKAHCHSIQYFKETRNLMAHFLAILAYCHGYVIYYLHPEFHNRLNLYCPPTEE